MSYLKTKNKFLDDLKKESANALVCLKKLHQQILESEKSLCGDYRCSKIRFVKHLLEYIANAKKEDLIGKKFQLNILPELHALEEQFSLTRDYVTYKEQWLYHYSRLQNNYFLKIQKENR